MSGRRSAAAAVVLLALSTASPARAQRFGQWTWDAAVALEGRGYANQAGDRRTGGYSSTDGRLSLGLNGFVLHPGIAQFRLQLDALLATYGSGAGLSGRSLGGRLDLRVLPIGAYPISLYVGRQGFSYEGAQTRAVGIGGGVADSTTTWGGRVRIRRGALAGLLGGYDGAALELADLARTQRDERGFLDWSAGGAGLQHHYSAERRFTQYASVPYRMVDYTLTGDEHGEIGRDWRLDASAIALRRTSELSGAGEAQVNTVSLAARLTRALHAGSHLSLAYSAGLSRATGTGRLTTHTGDVRYSFDAGRGVQLAPFGSYTVQDGEDVATRVPIAGVSAAWTARPGRVGTLLTASAALGRLSVSGREKDVAGSRFEAFSAGVDVRAGDERVLAVEVGAAWASNQVRQAGKTVSGLPDLGAGLAGAGTEDSLSGRLRLRKRWGDLGASGWAEWRRREANDPRGGHTLSADDVLGTLQLDWRSMSLSANAGETAVRNGAEQRVDFRSAALFFRPSAFLTLQASHRDEARALLAGPEVDSRRDEITLDFRIGLFALQAQAFVAVERVAAGSERSDTGFAWRLSRSFAGWLPVVSAPERRGVTR